MSLADSQMARDIMREFGRHPVDTSYLDVQVMHGVVYLRGRVDRVRGFYESIDLNKEFQKIVTILRQKPGIRDVCCELEVGAPHLVERKYSVKKCEY